VAHWWTDSCPPEVGEADSESDVPGDGRMVCAKGCDARGPRPAPARGREVTPAKADCRFVLAKELGPDPGVDSAMLGVAGLRLFRG
jgi:hypothetical protein